MAAVLARHDEVIHWPTEDEKEEAKKWVEEHSCPAWRGGFCLADGTLATLFEKPGYRGETYFDRKSNYSFSIQIISLPNLQIIDYVIGHTGSVHDSAAFSNSLAAQEHSTLFGHNEFIWTDSAYGATTWNLAPYKRPAADIPVNRRFNYHVSR
ncbi:hypothetical protein FRC08_011165, partial [Ceratobasidium sp. 394]